jgi:hypothetical protein
MNVLALNAGSGSLRYKLFARRAGYGPTTESLLKERSFDRVQGRATVEAAEQPSPTACQWGSTRSAAGWSTAAGDSPDRPVSRRRCWRRSAT